MIRSKYAVYTSWRPIRFAQVVIAIGLTLIMAGPSMPSVAAHPESISSAPRQLNRIKFETDACGSLADMKGGRSILMETSGTDESGQSNDDFDTDNENWVSAWGMSAEASAMIERWILEHPQVAIVTYAIQKSCGAGDNEDRDAVADGVV